MPYVPIKGRRLLLLAAASAALSLVPLALLVLLWEEWTWEVETFELLRGLELFWSISVYSLASLIPVCAIAPFAVVQYMNGRYVDTIERSMSSFFKGVADGIRSGMPIIKSIEVSARSIGGPLGREMLSVVSAVELGSSLEEALESLLRGVATPGLRRAANLLITAYRSGGRVADVLDAAAEMYGMIRSYEEERRASLAPYVWTVYIALAVFLVISTVLITVFVAPLYKLRGTEFFTPLPPPLFKAMFFIASLVQAASGGLVAGKIGKGTVKAGLIHSLILMLTVIAYFALLEVWLEPALVPSLP